MINDIVGRGLAPAETQKIITDKNSGQLLKPSAISYIDIFGIFVIVGWSISIETNGIDIITAGASPRRTFLLFIICNLPFANCHLP